MEVPQDFEVLSDAWQTVQLFLRLQTQWNVIDGGFIGLNYQSVDFLFKIERITNQSEMLADLQIMEFAALRILNERKD